MNIKTFRILSLIALCSITSGNLFGQAKNPNSNWLSGHPVEIAVGNFSVGMPFSNVFINRLYPAATVGTEFYYNKGQYSEIYQTAKFGGYYSRHCTSSIFVISETGYRYSFGFGLFTDANLGMGYSHLFRPGAIYKLNEGAYEQIRDWGKPSLMIDFSFSLGYDFSKQLKAPVAAFVRYGNYIQLLYNPDIPVLAQNSFQIGVRFLVNKKNSSNGNS